MCLVARCRAEIAAIEGQIRAGHPDLQGLCLALADWSAELRLLRASQGLATVGPRLAHVRSGGNRLPCGTNRQELTPQRESPPPASTGGGPGRKGRLMLLVEAIAALAALGLEGFYLVTGLLHRAGHKSTNGVSLPFHGLHDLRNGGPAFALEHGDYLGHLAALARPATFLRLGGLLGFGRGLGRGGLLGRLGLRGRALGGLCATLGVLFRLRLRGLFRFRLLGCAQPLDALPDAAGGRLVALEALHGRDASQAVKNRDQSLRRPRFGQFRQFLLAGEGIEGGLGCGGGLVLVRKRGNVVLFVNGESRHSRSPVSRALRGHHMNPSEALESKGLSQTNRTMAKNWR